MKPKSIAEREIRPKEPTTLMVEVSEPGHPGVGAKLFPVKLKAVRDGFAWTEEDGPYCLQDGWLQCYADGGVRLTPESLAVCKALEAQGKGEGH